MDSVIPNTQAASLQEQIRQAESSLSEFERTFAQTSSAMGRTFSRFFTDVVKGDIKNLRSAFTQLALGLQDDLVRRFLSRISLPAGGAGSGSLLDSLLSGGGLLSALGSLFAGGRAIGGGVASGAPVLVGERGPELFIPHQSGAITPNHALTSGNSTINMSMTIVTPDAGSFRASQGQIMAEAALALRRAHRNL